MGWRPERVSGDGWSAKKGGGAAGVAGFTLRARRIAALLGGRKEGKIPGSSYSGKRGEQAPVVALDVFDIAPKRRPGRSMRGGSLVPHAGVMRCVMLGTRNTFPRHIGIVGKRRNNHPGNKNRQDEGRPYVLE